MNLTVGGEDSVNLREKLISVALEWQEFFGIAPAITSALSEYDAAMLIGCTEPAFQKCLGNMTAVTKGYDFIFEEKRYQVKASRPSGKKGSSVTLVSKAKNYDWDYLIWILYNKSYEIQEAWLWDVKHYKMVLGCKKRLSPDDMRQGKNIYSNCSLMDDTERLEYLNAFFQKDLTVDKKPDFIRLNGRTLAYWQATRLKFWKEGIDPLNADDLFLVWVNPESANEYQEGYFLSTKQEFLDNFPSVVISKSYNGLASSNKAACYHFPYSKKLEAKMKPFFVPFYP